MIITWEIRVAGIEIPRPRCSRLVAIALNCYTWIDQSCCLYAFSLYARARAHVCIYKQENRSCSRLKPLDTIVSQRVLLRGINTSFRGLKFIITRTRDTRESRQSHAMIVIIRHVVGVFAARTSTRFTLMIIIIIYGSHSRKITRLWRVRHWSQLHEPPLIRDRINDAACLIETHGGIGKRERVKPRSGRFRDPRPIVQMYHL